MSEMTQLERYRAFLARERPDRPLRRADYTPHMLAAMKERLGGVHPGEYFDSDDGRSVALRQPDGYQRPDFSGYYEGSDDLSGINAIGVLHQKGDFYHFTRIVSPLRNATSLDEIEAFPIETEEDWPEDGMAAEVEQYHREGRYVRGIVAHLYEDSVQIRGYEPFLMDLLIRRDLAESILDRVTRRNVRRTAVVARAGVDVLMSGDDIANQKAMMYSPDLWREVFKPRWAEIYAAARRVNPDLAIWYHSDGNMAAVIPDLIEIGVTILNPMQPECMDVEEIFARCGDRLLFDGTMGTQSVFPWGTPDDMRGTVRRRREVFGDALMLSPTHVLEPEVPPENVFAFFEACDGKSYAVPEDAGNGDRA